MVLIRGYIRNSFHDKGLGLTLPTWDEGEAKVALSEGVGVELEADSKGQPAT